MWSTFIVHDEDSNTVGPMGLAAAAGGGGGGAGGGAQGAGGLTGLVSGRGRFGGNKRRRTTSAGHSMSEAQEGKVTVCILPVCLSVIQSDCSPLRTNNHLQADPPLFSDGREAFQM